VGFGPFDPIIKIINKYADTQTSPLFTGFGFITSMFQKLPGMENVNMASSPILLAAQTIMVGFKLETGNGDPISGDPFKISSAKYEEAGELLGEADTVDEWWNGSAAERYAAKNQEHKEYTQAIAEAEGKMVGYLNDLKDQILSTRGTLDGAIGVLADFDAATGWMNNVPGGARAKAYADLACVATQMPRVESAMLQLQYEELQCAWNVHDLVSAYEHASTGEVTFTELEQGNHPDFPEACGEPFGDERSKDSRLPSLTVPGAPDAPDLPVTLPDPYPPATPYGR
jgi:hypothetical protein